MDKPDLYLEVYRAEAKLREETERINQDPAYLAARIALADAVTAYNVSLMVDTPDTVNIY